MRKISASELGTFLYCQRSWWYARHGEKSENQPEMDLGSQVHHIHSRNVKQSQVIQWLAFLLFLVGFILLLWYLLP